MKSSFRSYLLISIVLATCAQTAHAQLPTGWTDQDIGTVGQAGSATYASSTGTFTVSGSGNDIYYTADDFNYCSQQVTGNFTFIARITGAGGTNVNGGAASGIMIRESLAANSREEMIYLEPGQYARTDVRQADGGSTVRNAIAQESFPYWLKLTRYGDQISLAYSSDGVNWSATNNATALVNLASSVYLGLAVTARNNSALNTATFDNVSLSSVDVSTATSWLGNTFPGGNEYVQVTGQALAVNPSTGNLFVNGSAEDYATTFYDTNGNFTAYGTSSHFNGGPAIAWDSADSYVWVGEAGTAGVAYYNTGGTYLGVVLNPLTTGTTIVGVAVANGNLYAVDNTSTVHVVSLSTKAQTSTFTLPAGAQNVAADSSGNLWVVFSGTGITPSVQHFGPTGTLLGSLTLTGTGNPGLAKPGGIAIDSSGNIYVADNGVNQQIQVFTSGGTFLRSFGAQYGIYSTSNGTTVGQTDPSKLDHPLGIAIDSSGNLYVTCNGPGDSWYTLGSGMVLRKYSSTTTASSSTLKWERQGLEAVSCAAADSSSDGVDVYSKYHHYVMDYSQPAGAEWTYKGMLLDDFAYPADTRLTDPEDSGAWVRTINGKKFLIVNDQQGGAISFFRFQSNSEVTVPYATFVRETARGQSTNALSIWCDKNANGVVDSGETDTSGQALGAPSNEVYSWSVDANGGVWSMGGGNNTIGGVKQPTLIWHFMPTTDANGNPSYSGTGSTVESFPVPAEFSGPYVLRLIYQPATDTMYVSGYTVANPKPAGIGFGAIGTEIIRYNNWRGVSGTRSLAYRIVVPCTVANAAKSFDVTGNLIAAVENNTHLVDLYDATTGAPEEVLSPGPEVGGTSGDEDCVDSLNLYQRANGEYLTFVEEDEFEKVLMYRWNPWTDLDIGTDGEAGSSSVDSTGTVYTIKGSGAGIGGAADDFHYLYRGLTGNGTIIARVTSVSDTNVYAKAGVMIRSSLTAGSPEFCEVTHPSSEAYASAQWRLTTGGSTGSASGSGEPLPYWVKVVRSGNSFSGYISPNGVTWTQQGATQTISMSTEVYVGLIVTSATNSALCTATLDNVSTTP
jgi:regulation of enolase protein 1 (concanavalin A-like superfamily)